MTKVINFLLLAVFFFPFSGYTQGNEVKITGKILDEKTQEPVIGATVSLAGSNTGTVSDIDGKFFLSVKSLPVTISIDYLGYKRQEVDVYESAEPVTILLSESRNILDEVVVVGYGTQKRKELTGAVTTISKETLSQPVVSFDNLLGGAVAGLNITQGGNPVLRSRLAFAAETPSMQAMNRYM